MPLQAVDGLWGQKASGSGLETTSGVPSKHPFLLETELWWPGAGPGAPPCHWPVLHAYLFRTVGSPSPWALGKKWAGKGEWRFGL